LGDSSREISWLRRIRGIALARLGRLEEAVDELEVSLSEARQSGALYDLAATLDVLHALDAEPEQRADERDSLLEQLGVERLPVLELRPETNELAVAINA
jgi:hypothetical protein